MALRAGVAGEESADDAEDEYADDDARRVPRRRIDGDGRSPSAGLAVRLSSFGRKALIVWHSRFAPMGFRMTGITAPNVRTPISATPTVMVWATFAIRRRSPRPRTRLSPSSRVPPRRSRQWYAEVSSTLAGNRQRPQVGSPGGEAARSSGRASRRRRAQAPGLPPDRRDRSSAAQSGACAGHWDCAAWVSSPFRLEGGVVKSEHVG